MKTMLILGASSDVGMAYMRQLEATHKSGEVQVIAHYRTMSSELEKVIISSKNIVIDAVQADLSLSDDVERLIGQIQAKYTAPTHVLHLAAGKFHHMRLRQFDSNTMINEMQIGVLSLGEILKAFLPAMAKKRYGKVVIMLTAFTIGIPPRFITDYLVCKYALLGLMKAAAAEYCDKGLCINGISPSMIETKFLTDIDHKIIEMSANDTPLKRNISIAEVIAGIEFLMSDDSSYMCGINLNLSGGAR